MAKYDITYSCGHSGRIDIVGKNRDNLIKWYQEKALCPQCYQEQQQKLQNEREKELIQKFELPELTGTEKQVKWANSLRNDAIRNMQSFYPNKLKKYKVMNVYYLKSH